MTNTADLEAARLLLSRLGINPTDLLNATAPRSAVPTFADYIPIVEAAVTAGTRRVYSTYWNRLVEHWGTRKLDEPTPTDIQHLAETIKLTLTIRRNARGGRSATEHLIAALRCIYRHAETTASSPPAPTQPSKSPNPDASTPPAEPSPTIN